MPILYPVVLFLENSPWFLRQSRMSESISIYSVKNLSCLHLGHQNHSATTRRCPLYGTVMQAAQNRVVLPFTQFLSLARSLAHSFVRARTSVPWLCNQVKVAQAPSSSSARANQRRRRRRFANSHTTYTYIFLLLLLLAQRHHRPSVRSEIPLHDRRRVLSS